MKQSSKWMIALGVAGGATALALGPGRKVAAGRIRRRANPTIDDLFALPDDVVRHDVPTHDGGTVHVIEVGQGRPLVLLHGVTLAAEVWAPIMHLARDRFRVIALDVRGHGRSQVGTEGVGRRLAAHDLATVLTELDLEGAVVCGHSMGGMILGQFCGDHPDVLTERVAGLGFMDTAVGSVTPPGMARLSRRFGAELVRRADAGRPIRLPGNPDDQLLMTRLAFGARPSGAAVEVARRLGHELSDDHRTHLWVDLYDTDNRAALRTVKVPSVVMVGSRDTLTPVYAAKRIMACLADARLEVVPGAGHQLMQERPFEVVGFFDDLVQRIESGA